MKLVLSFTLLVLVGHSAHAQRTVRNGGGLAEMKLIYLHQNLHTYLELCLTPNNPCHLSSNQSILFRSVLSFDKKEVSSVVVAFNEHVNPTLAFQTEKTVGAPVQISPSSLYTDDLPKPAGELLAFVFSIRWFHLPNSPDQGQILKAAAGLFAGMTEQLFTTRLSMDTDHIRLHQGIIQFSNSGKSFFFLEDPAKTTDLTPTLLGILNCGPEIPFLVQNLQFKTQGRSYLVWGAVKTTCPTSAKVLVLRFQVDDREIVIPSSVHASLRAN